MRKWISGIFVIGLLTVGLAEIKASPAIEGKAGSKPNSVEFHEGQLFPTTVFPSLEDSRPASVADFRGKKLILHIFASW
jgi:hypothetical protein